MSEFEERGKRKRMKLTHNREPPVALNERRDKQTRVKRPPERQLGSPAKKRCLSIKISSMSKGLDTLYKANIGMGARPVKIVGQSRMLREDWGNIFEPEPDGTDTLQSLHESIYSRHTFVKRKIFPTSEKIVAAHKTPSGTVFVGRNGIYLHRDSGVELVVAAENLRDVDLATDECFATLLFKNGSWILWDVESQEVVQKYEGQKATCVTWYFNNVYFGLKTGEICRGHNPISSKIGSNPILFMETNGEYLAVGTSNKLLIYRNFQIIDEYSDSVRFFSWSPVHPQVFLSQKNTGEVLFGNLVSEVFYKIESDILSVAWFDNKVVYTSGNELVFIHIQTIPNLRVWDIRRISFNLGKIRLLTRYKDSLGILYDDNLFCILKKNVCHNKTKTVLETPSLIGSLFQTIR